MRFGRAGKVGLGAALVTAMAVNQPLAQDHHRGDSTHHQTVGKRGKRDAVVTSHQAQTDRPKAQVVAISPEKIGHGKGKHGGGQPINGRGGDNVVAYRNEKGYRKRVETHNRGRRSVEHGGFEGEEHVIASGTGKGGAIHVDDTPYVSRREVLQKRELKAKLRDQSIKRARGNKRKIQDLYERVMFHEPGVTAAEIGGGVAATTVAAQLVDDGVTVKDGRPIPQISGLPAEWSADPVTAASTQQAQNGAERIVADAEQGVAAGKISFLTKLGSQTKTSFAAAKPMAKLTKGLGAALGAGLILKGAKDLIAPKVPEPENGEQATAEQKSTWTDRLKGAGEIAVGTVGGYVALTHGGKGGTGIKI